MVSSDYHRICYSSVLDVYQESVFVRYPSMQVVIYVKAQTKTLRRKLLFTNIQRYQNIHILRFSWHILHWFFCYSPIIIWYPLFNYIALKIFCKVVVITHIEYQYDSAFHFTELLSLKLQDKCTRSNEKWNTKWPR